MERSQRKIQQKDELTWPAYILTCSPHVLSPVLASNSTSLLAVTCPCKNQAGWPFWWLYRNVDFSAHNHAQETNSRKPQVKIRFAFFECNEEQNCLNKATFDRETTLLQIVWKTMWSTVHLEPLNSEPIRPHSNVLY